MRTFTIASIAAALATLAVLPAVACDYSHEANNVTASATPAPAAEVQAAVPAAQPAPAEPAATQTAETTTSAAPQPKLN